MRQNSEEDSGEDVSQAVMCPLTNYQQSDRMEEERVGMKGREED